MCDCKNFPKCTRLTFNWNRVPVDVVDFYKTLKEYLNPNNRNWEFYDKRRRRSRRVASFALLWHKGKGCCEWQPDYDDWSRTAVIYQCKPEFSDEIFNYHHHDTIISAAMERKRKYSSGERRRRRSKKEKERWANFFQGQLINVQQQYQE